MFYKTKYIQLIHNFKNLGAFTYTRYSQNEHNIMVSDWIEGHL